MIRLDSANQLCDAMRVNRTLTYLDLSYNALGTEGGLRLGSSLLENKTLKVLQSKTLNFESQQTCCCSQSLLVAHNSLDSIACTTICAGVLENEGLVKLVLDGNPIGEEGAKTLMVCASTVISLDEYLLILVT